MGRLFWIINAAVLVVALGLWGVGTRGVRGDVEDLERQLGTEISSIERLREKLVNESFIEAERGFKTHLEAEREKLKGVMGSRDLNIEEFDSQDALVVDQMLEPIIMGPDGVIRTGTVTLRKVES